MREGATDSTGRLSAFLRAGLCGISLAHHMLQTVSLQVSSAIRETPT